ncbi:MAG TPA: CAP domain-containing protein [Solirubrobacteraceae bacterium]|jgi:uncharacterized protein YkwD|nr:CAP domain-containing protein [Solirubrobacteraceae bacterium]
MRLPLRVPTLAVLMTAAALVVLPSPVAVGRSCRDVDAAITSHNLAGARAAVLCLVNVERTSRGLPALRSDARLAAAALEHTDDMLAHGYFDHVGPDGTHPGDRVTSAGYHWAEIAENIASAQATPGEVMAAWMASTGHCRNILDPNVTDVGIGIAPRSILGDSGATWTQELGRRITTPAPAASSAPQSGCPYGHARVGDHQLVASTSARLTVRASSVIHGRTVTVRGTVTPGQAGRRVHVAVARGEERVRRSVTTRTGGSFSVTLTAPAGEGTIRPTVKVDGVPTLRL